MVDYLLTLEQSNVLLDDSAFRMALDETRTSAEADSDRFQSWLHAVSEADCRSASGKNWEIRSTTTALRVYWICLPKITELSATIKKLRTFTDAVRAGRVFLVARKAE